MAWELKKVEDQRQALIEAYISGTETMKDLCRCYGISRKTAYKWLNRYKTLGSNGLKDQSRAPIEPSQQYSEEVIQKAIDLKLKYSKWGPRKILQKLRNLYPRMDWPSATRLYEIFKEENLVKCRRWRKRVSATHPLGEVNQSNDVWIADFKGWFLTQDQTKCEPLTITDGFSRYLIKCEHMRKKRSEDVWEVFVEAFEEYGLPNRIRTDNGPPFGSVGIGRLTRLGVNLIKAGIKPEWINPGHPEENGRHERFHLTLKEAVAMPACRTLKEQILKMGIFEREYNFERPHEALGMSTPSDFYKNSERQWDGQLRSPEYGDDYKYKRKVGSSGCIWLKQIWYYLAEVLEGEYVGIKELEEGLGIFYGPIYLGKLDERKKRVEAPKLKMKKIVRRG